MMATLSTASLMSRNSISRTQRTLRLLLAGVCVGAVFARLGMWKPSATPGNGDASQPRRNPDEEIAALKLDLAEAEIERQRVIWRMNRAVEEERRRLASELHRRPLQELTGIGYQLERVSMALHRGDHESASEIIDEAAVNLTNQLESIRMIMTNLRPPILDEHGLAGSLEAIRARLHRDHPELQLELTGHRIRLGTETETAFYRVAQEGLDNVVRHAHASSVALRIEADEQAAQLTIIDDGCGFDISLLDNLDPIQSGIVSMQDRMAMIDGTIDFDSNDAGTVVVCRAPRADLSAVFENELTT